MLGVAASYSDNGCAGSSCCSSLNLQWEVRSSIATVSSLDGKNEVLHCALSNIVPLYLLKSSSFSSYDLT